MKSPGDVEGMQRPPVCGHCGAVMGVYEPLVCLVGGRVRRSSRAAEPELLHRAKVCYHAACFERRSASVVDAA